MDEKGLRAWEKRRRKAGVFVTGFSSSYLSLSLPDFYSLSHLPPPLFSSLSLSLSLIVSPSFLYHLFSLPLTSIPPSPPLITHPPTNKPQPLTAPPSPFPPSFSLPSLPPPPQKTPQYSRQERPMRPRERCAKEDETGIKTRTTRNATLKSALDILN